MSVETKLAALDEDVRSCGMRIVKLEVESSAVAETLKTLVTQHEFSPVKLIAFGLAGGVMLTVLTAVLAKTLGI